MAIARLKSAASKAETTAAAALDASENSRRGAIDLFEVL
jgi:hypothetical protein